MAFCGAGSKTDNADRAANRSGRRPEPRQPGRPFCDLLWPTDTVMPKGCSERAVLLFITTFSRFFPSTQEVKTVNVAFFHKSQNSYNILVVIKVEIRSVLQHYT